MDLLEALGNGTRLAILRQLSREPMYVSELAEATGMDGTTAVHHLSTLEEAGLVTHYRRGNRKYYELVQRVELRIAPPPERTFVLQADEADEHDTAADD
ncbi:regulatory protein ArsR [Natrinema pellirubrum DSM 15624]|uniref:Regulatory protein ArsR n=2 Tax=Natrinema TaxID=88723 RepID=L0JM41_NATP1|nr:MULTISPECIES: metalloregulator ArsR/SmtB family transcription factor [Natrinema]ELZ09642.1 regulatory protein ArsR [Natrinema thermotolerans DSM 11552]AGB31431.1 putative transcriptional regulator [Natrinema pellirubrum DSM 15624]ELY82016.1 regulatory protein ArsR [Natrinema pellirubrum DSM 15624]QCC60276.1 ArsR family transcriptional regulator [Natrinema thermotolerans]QCC61186.1 ArsR family transcriptional regulator [Natrinema thermotolerans]